jgi:hypothetical protein
MSPRAYLIFLTLAVSSLLILANCAPRPEDSRPEDTSSPAVALPDSLRVPRAVLLDSGAVYFQACAICHGGNGRGGRGPAVANSDYVMGDRTRLIRSVLDGVRDSIRVNGVRWRTGEMLGWAETWPDFKIAAVLTYIRAALNDSLVVSCVPEDAATGTWASCESVARTPGDIAADSIAVHEVSAVRASLRPQR